MKLDTLSEIFYYLFGKKKQEMPRARNSGYRLIKKKGEVRTSKARRIKNNKKGYGRSYGYPEYKDGE